MEVNVTNKTKSANFEGVEGQYKFNGMYYSRKEEELSEIQGGMVRKGDAIIGNFYAHIEGDVLKFSISNMDLSEIVVVAPMLDTLKAALEDQLEETELEED